MKRNLFVIVFIFFSSVVFYKFGPTTPSKPKIAPTGIDPSKEQKLLGDPTNSTTSVKPQKKLEAKPKEAKLEATPSPNVPSNPLYPSLNKTELSSKKGLQKDYFELKNNVLDSIPLKEALRIDAKKSPHSPSSSLIIAGKALGEYKSLLLQHPTSDEIQIDAQAFYEQCASYTAYPNSIRSLCLYNRTVLSKNKGEKFDTSSYPEEIRKVLTRPGM